MQLLENLTRSSAPTNAAAANYRAAPAVNGAGASAQQQLGTLTRTVDRWSCWRIYRGRAGALSLIDFVLYCFSISKTHTLLSMVAGSSLAGQNAFGGAGAANAAASILGPNALNALLTSVYSSLMDSPETQEFLSSILDQPDAYDNLQQTFPNGTVNIKIDPKTASRRVSFSPIPGNSILHNFRLGTEGSSCP